MFKFVVLVSALVLSASAMPADVATERGILSSWGNAMVSKASEIRNTIKQTGVDAAGLVHNVVHSGTDIASDAVVLGKDLTNAGVSGAASIAMDATSKAANITNSGMDLVNTMIKPIPVVSNVVGAGLGVGKGAVAGGTNIAIHAMGTAEKVGNTAVNAAASVATNVLSAVDKASATGTGWAQSFWGWV